jgi:hypothetical protein
MKTLYVDHILPVLLMISMTLAIASPAFANAPVKNVYVIDNSYTCNGGETDNCWNPCNFAIQMHDYGTFRVNVWSDENGTHEIDIFGNLKRDWSANNKTINIQEQGPIFNSFEYYPDKIVYHSKMAGADVIVTVPHYGRISGGGGLMLETLIGTPDWSEIIYYNMDKLAGNLINDWSPVCTYLGS